MFKKIMYLSLIALMLFSVVAASNATHTLTVQSQGWLGGDEGGKSGEIQVFTLDGKTLTTKISPGETKTVNLTDNAKEVDFHVDGRSNTYNGDLNKLQDVFTLFPNANFYANVWFYEHSRYYVKAEYPRSGYIGRDNSIDAWRVTTLEDNSKLTITGYNAKVYTVNKDNTNTLITDNGDYTLIPNSVNKKTVFIQSKSKDYTVEIPMYKAPKDITITSGDGGMAVNYNDKRVVANKNNPHRVI